MRSAVARLCSTPVGSETRGCALSSTNGDFAALASGLLLWLPDLGIGYLDHPPAPGLYGHDYWQTYRELDDTPMGAALTKCRVEMVLRHYGSTDLIDVGIGGGRFVREMDCLGWDINPEAIRWLYENKCLRDPRSSAVDAVTMWDSIEHMHDPSDILRNVREWAFISTPIYATADLALESKHFKPGEHLWYFTEFGLLNFMRAHGFKLVEANDGECSLGRESIGSYAFRRVP